MDTEVKRIVAALRVTGCDADSDCERCDATYYCHTIGANLERDAADLIECQQEEIEALKKTD